MVLLGQLFLGQLVQYCHLLGKDSGHQETFGEQHDLTDLLQIRHNDHHWTEQRLHRLGQLSTTGISGIHGDEDADTVIRTGLLSLKLE